jgi:hypothetical protein
MLGDKIDDYYDIKKINKHNIDSLIKKHKISDAELVFLRKYNKDIPVPVYWEYTGRTSKLKYNKIDTILFQLFLMKNGYISMKLYVFLGLLSGYLLYKKLPKSETSTAIKLFKSDDEYVEPNDDVINLIKILKNYIDKKRTRRNTI